MSRSALQAIILDNPYTREALERITLTSTTAMRDILAKSKETQQAWRSVPVSERVELGKKFLTSFAAKKEAIAHDLTLQIGKPIKQSRGEVDTTIARAEAILRFAPTELADEVLPDKGNVSRVVVKEPVGTAVVISPWNYPLLCGINAILPAVLAGNAVTLKPSFRSSRVGKHFEEAFNDAGFPTGLVKAFYPPDQTLAGLLSQRRFGAVSFTGSTEVGTKVATAVAPFFPNLVLELGSKDGAYVASDADLAFAIDSLVDGVVYNAGQSCCGIKRIFVHESLYEQFVEGATELMDRYVYGDPLSEDVNLGPIATDPSFYRLLEVLKTTNAERTKITTRTREGGKKGRYFPPTLIYDPKGTSHAMKADYFGPMVVVTSVASDEAAARAINDSKYGLTAAVFTSDMARGRSIGEKLNVGTVFFNRCDYLDPDLPWSGRKASGNGKSLGKYAFDAYYRTKSYNMRDLSKSAQ